MLISVENRVRLEEEFIQIKKNISDLIYRIFELNEAEINFQLPYETAFEDIEFGGNSNLRTELHQDVQQDRFTVLILNMIGHQWHKQIEAGEPVPAWAYQDGVIPINKGTNKQALGDRVRERIGAEFPNHTVAIIAAEFEEIVGISLEK